MFNPQEDEIVEHWFQQLNAPLKRLPAEEQTRVQEEVWQHLEALATVSEKGGRGPMEAWEAALEQFGDPELFGRLIAEEWRQSRAGFRADIMAIVFGLALYAFFYCPIEHPLCALWFKSLREAHGISVVGFVSVLGATIIYGGMIFINILIGLKYPWQAIKSAFYSHVLFNFVLFIFNYVALMLSPGVEPLSWSAMWLAVLVHPNFLFLIPAYALLWTSIAYLASVTKRGWYQPSLADFKIILPHSRWKIAR